MSRLVGYRLNPDLWRRWSQDEAYRDRVIQAIAPRVHTILEAADWLLPYIADPVWEGGEEDKVEPTDIVA